MQGTPEGRVGGLRLRLGDGPAKSVDTLFLDNAGGILGDSKFDPASSRQILVACSKVLRDLSLPPGVLSENVLVDIGDSDLTPGSVLCLGDDVRLWLLFRCEVCKRLAERVGVTVARRLVGRRGVLARVIRGGEVSVGSKARIEKGNGRARLDDRPRERLREVLCITKPGEILSYRAAAKIIGVPLVACRAFPAHRRALEDTAPTHRLVPSNLRIDQLDVNQLAALSAEDAVLPNTGVLRAPLRAQTVFRRLLERDPSIGGTAAASHHGVD